MVPASTAPAAVTGVAAAWRRRCPRCGERDIWQGWGELRAACPRCALTFAREEGYWVGVVIVNLALAELVLAALLLAVGLATWPAVPWTALTATGVVAMVAVPVWFYPRAKTLWVWLDLRLHPPEPQ